MTIIDELWPLLLYTAPPCNSDAALEYHIPGRSREEYTPTDNQQQAMLLATEYGEDGDREAEHRDKIEMQTRQPGTVENGEELKQESVGKEDKQQILTDINR